MSYRITTDEPLERWCRPLHEGQVIDVVDDDDDPSPTNTGSDTTIRRYVATRNAAGELYWEECPRSYVTMKGTEPTKVAKEDRKPKTKAKKKR